MNTAHTTHTTHTIHNTTHNTHLRRVLWVSAMSLFARSWLLLLIWGFQYDSNVSVLCRFGRLDYYWSFAYLSNCILFVRFLSRGRESFLPSSRFLCRSFLQYPEYLDYPFLRLSLPTMIPAGFLTSTAYSYLG